MSEMSRRDVEIHCNALITAGWTIAGNPWQDLDESQRKTIEVQARRIKELESRLATHEALREKLEHWSEYWNGCTNESAMIDALTHITGEINDLLASLKETL